MMQSIFVSLCLHKLGIDFRDHELPSTQGKAAWEKTVPNGLRPLLCSSGMFRTGTIQTTLPSPASANWSKGTYST